MIEPINEPKTREKCRKAQPTPTPNPNLALGTGDQPPSQILNFFIFAPLTIFLQVFLVLGFATDRIRWFKVPDITGLDKPTPLSKNIFIQT